MGTVRDDLVRAGRRLRETVEDRTGRQVVDAERLRLLESAESDARVMRKTLEYIGWNLFNYQGQSPFELNPQVRWYSYAQALRAWCEDPLAGAAVDLYISFVFGRGVPRPQGHDDEVQAVLDRTVDDPANQRVLTSYPKLIEKGIDLCLQSQVFFTVNDEGEDGRVVLSLLRFQDVLDAVRHPKDRFRILWFRCVERTYSYDFANGQLVQPSEEQTQPQTVYYEVLDAFDDENPAMVAQDDGLARPPASMLRPGKVLAVQVNKTSEMGFGVPRMRRLLRWYEAYNSMIESHVNRMKAMASVYMKATARGDQTQLDKLAMMARQRTSAFGQTHAEADEVRGGPLGERAGLGPQGPGILTENESLQWSNFKIDSGASDVSTAAPIVRGQAGGPWPDHYLSGSADGAIAGMQCHDVETETLTEDGWLTLDQLKARDAAGSLPRVAAFDVQAQRIVYQQPIGGLKLYRYDGEMMRFASQRVDMLVTPNHRMLVRRSPKGVRPRSDLEFIEAGGLGGIRREARAAALLAGGERVEVFRLPEHPISGARAGAARGEYAGTRERNARIRALALSEPAGWGRIARIAEKAGCSALTAGMVLRGDNGYRRRAPMRMRPAVTIPMDAWLRWLGWYIAEGSEGAVAQSEDSPWLGQIRAACQALGVEGVERFKNGRPGRARTWTWTPRNPGQWRAWLDEHAGCGAANKRVPAFVWELPREQQMEVLRGIMGGDGNGDPAGRWETQGSSQIGTTSRQLANDLQRLGAHCGFVTRLAALPEYDTKKGRRTPYVVGLYAGESSHAIRDHCGMPRPTRERYRGEVYCFTTPAQTLITRRNGLMAFQGNSMELPVLKFCEMEQELWGGMHRRFYQCAIDRAVEVGDISEWREATEEEQERIQAFEKDGVPLDSLDYDPETQMVKRDLSFDLSLPNPLKRAMLDVVTAAQTVAKQIDPTASNPEMSRWLFSYVLAEAFDVEDPMRIVDQVLPRLAADDEQTDTGSTTVNPDDAAGDGLERTGAIGPDGDRHQADNAYGAPRQSPNPEDRQVQEAPVPTNGNGNGHGMLRPVPERVRQAMREHHSTILAAMTPRMRAALAAFFVAQRSRIIAAVGGHEAGVLERSPDPISVLFDQAAENEALLEVMMPLLDEIGVTALESAPAEAPVSSLWNVESGVIRSARERLAARVTGINETTRADLAKVLDQGLRAGYEPAQIVRGVPGDGYPGILGSFDQAISERADLIAQTETASAYNVATLSGFQDNGVQLVEVSDGDGCDICAITNGAIWTVDMALSDPLQHPRCARNFSPALATADNLAIAEAAAEARSGDAS